MSAQNFVAAARGLKGARWRHRGRQQWAVDCIGLVVLSGRASGLQMNDQVGYGREPWDDRLRKACREHFGEPVSVGDIQSGCVVLIRWKNGEPSHVAIVADHPDGGLSLIHTDNLHGVVECSMSGDIKRCIVEVYRPRWER